MYNGGEPDREMPQRDKLSVTGLMVREVLPLRMTSKWKEGRNPVGGVGPAQQWCQCPLEFYAVITRNSDPVNLFVYTVGAELMCNC